MSNLKLITGEKNIMAAAKDAAKGSQKAGMAVHIVLCSALAHVMQHGNTNVIDQVYATVHQSLNHRGIGIFFRQFTNLRSEEQEDGSVKWRKPAKKPLAVKMDEAKANPYWTLKASVAGNTAALFDVEKRFASLIGQIRFHIGAEDVKEKATATALLKELEPIAKAREIDLSEVPSIADGKAAAKAKAEAKAKEKATVNKPEPKVKPDNDAGAAPATEEKAA